MLIAVNFLQRTGARIAPKMWFQTVNNTPVNNRPPVVIEEKFGWQNRLLRHAARHGN